VIIPSIIAKRLVLPSFGGELSTGLRASGRSARFDSFFFDREDLEEREEDREEREDLDLESESELIVMR